MFYINNVITAALSFGVAIYMLTLALAKDIKYNFESFHKMVEGKKNRSQLLKKFKFAVQYHSIAIKLSFNAVCQ